MLDSLLIPSWLHAALLLTMIVLILTGRRSGTHEQRRRTRVDQAGLRAGLIAELSALRTVYRLNADLIAAGTQPIISGRTYFSLYRGSMHRLVSLSPAEVSAVVTAHAASDMLDGAAHVATRTRGRETENAVVDMRALDIGRLQRAARITVDDAITILQNAAAEAQQFERTTWRHRLGAWFDRMRGIVWEQGRKVFFF